MTAIAKVEAIVSFDTDLQKYVCSINNNRIGASVYPDYFEYHYKRGDRVVSQYDIAKFVNIAQDGTRTEVVAVRKATSANNIAVEVLQAQAAVVTPSCTHCGSTSFSKNGKTAAGAQRYKCSDKACGKGFKLV